MSDVCFTCPLPDCNELDPRCAYRQTDGFLRFREMQRASYKRQIERKRSQDQSAAFMESHKEELLRRANITRFKILWDSGLGSYEIAQKMGVEESVVHNEFLRKGDVYDDALAS